jgi:hypothetical protein
MESAISGVFSAEVHGADFASAVLFPHTQAHPRSIDGACLFTYEHLRISFRHRGRRPAIAITFGNFRFDESQQFSSLHWNIRHSVQPMCCIEQTFNSQCGTNNSAPPASQNLVKGGSP